jgi:hypothetical protein
MGRSAAGAREHPPEPFRFPATPRGPAGALERIGPMMTAFAPAATRWATHGAAFFVGFRKAYASLPGTRPYRRTSGR